ncbi:hypothetical protein DQ04_10791020 [Trypanosoma grayi]|uniref:hypothetical protein n=1 Tax=Trypanosoma grayi TaxID=71804 RepID=UPI0004F49B4C|nr:hypothetical protein DQ04_10791020 [Trypanosoma grayi]KEG07132.1 hypothetical protein DQ04_10791020 [Trypanosoma grayi]
MRCVLFMCALCVWCAGGCSGLNGIRHVEVPYAGGYAVKAGEQGSHERAAEPCDPGSTVSGGSCTVGGAIVVDAGPVGCKEQGISEECEGPGAPESCKGNVQQPCGDQGKSVTGGSCPDGKKEPCTGSTEALSGSNVDDAADGGHGIHKLTDENDSCPQDKREANGSCASSPAASKALVKGEDGKVRDLTASGEGERGDRSGGNGDCGKGKGVDRSADSSAAGSCPNLPVSPPDNNSQLPAQPQPQQQTGQVERDGGKMIPEEANERTNDERLELQKRGHVSSGGGAKHDNFKEEKKEKTTFQTDAKNSGDNSEREIIGGSTNNSKEEPSSDASHSAEDNHKAGSSAEDNPAEETTKKPNSQVSGESNDSMQPQSSHAPASLSAPEATNKPRNNPVVQNLKDTKNADSSVSLVWLHAPLLLLTLFAVTAV